jgi:hypothetical protein
MKKKTYILITFILNVILAQGQLQFSKGQSDYVYPIDWNNLGNNSFGTTAIIPQMMNMGATGSTNFPTHPLYPYGILMNFNTQINSARAQMYISHNGNDLIFRGGWESNWQSWNKVLTNNNFSNYAYPSQGGLLNGPLSTGQYLKLTGGIGDVNDGKICNSHFAQGLNIVGINNDNTYRKIALWGQISQQENGGGNSWVGTNNFNGNVNIIGNMGIGTSNLTAKLNVVGNSLLTRDGAGECCSGGNYTLAIAENTIITNNKASISFHNAGFDEGKMELSKDIGFRSIKFFDHQNQGLGIDVKGKAYIQDNVSIGTTNTSLYKLAVEGTIGARKLKVTQDTWADHVFKPNYKLRPLNEVEAYIKKYKHLPDVPSENEVIGKDIDISETQALLLKKIEELTLYIIQIKKENIEIKKKLNLK